MSDNLYKISARERETIISWILIRSFIVMLGLLVGLTLVYLLSLPTQMLVAIGVGLLLLIFPVQPAVFLLGYLVSLAFLDLLIPFFSTQLFGLRFGPQILFRGGVIVLLVYYWLINQRNPLAFKPAVPMFILSLLIAFSSISGGSNVKLGLVSLAKLVYWFFLLLTVADMVAQGKMKLETIYRCVIISILGFIVVVFISPIVGIDLGSYYGIGDVRGPYAPHSLALCSCIALIVTLALAVQQKNKFSSLFLMSLSAVIVITIVRAYTRTGYTSLLASLFMFALMVWRYGRREVSIRRNKWMIALAFITVIGALGFFGLAFSEKLHERIGDLSSIQTAGSGRLVIYKAALTRYADFSAFKKIFGGGLQATQFLVEKDEPHNELLLFLLASGLLGISLYFWLLVNLWKQISSTAHGTYWPLIIANSVMAAFLVATMTNPVVGYMSVMTYFSFLVGGAMGYYARVDRFHTVSRERQNPQRSTF